MIRDIENRYANLGRQLHGGSPVHTSVPLPAPSIPAPAVPTETMVIDGIALEPASRLHALASIRDGHRARARMASDRMHAIREQISERELRIKLIGQKVSPGFETEAEAQVAVLEAEISQLRAAMQTAQDEASEAGEAAGAADRLFRAARDFAVQKGAVLPILLTAEVR